MALPVVWLSQTAAASVQKGGGNGSEAAIAEAKPSGPQEELALPAISLSQTASGTAITAATCSGPPEDEQGQN